MVPLPHYRLIPAFHFPVVGIDPHSQNLEKLVLIVLNKSVANAPVT